ncbi:IclR family transcriptional regulator [Jiangella asiatica]|uniref:IclR family transcriptional regulator n=1 Tax=Jiangella asiatica TaxID=2530372 RepID=UPI001EF05939|nr:helix-turn-helix domain-containing protein [Jiangella asiatica]
MVEISQTLDRGLRLLEVLAGSSSGLTVAEASGVLGVNRTIVYRLLATLEQHGLVRRVAGGRFCVGFAALTLASSVHPLLRQVAQPVLRSLAEDVGATAHLTIADGVEALAVAVVEPTRTDYHVAYRVGTRHPLERGAAGRAILAGRSGDVRAEAPGFVATTGELQTGASGVAAPVPAVAGVEASVGVIALGELDAESIGPRTVRAAVELARRLG